MIQSRLQSFGASALCQLSCSSEQNYSICKKFFHTEALVNTLLVGGPWASPEQVGVVVDSSIFFSYDKWGNI